MSTERTIYAISHAWAEAAQALTRVRERGASLGNRERRAVKEALSACESLTASLTGPHGDLTIVAVAERLLAVVQPIYSRPTLVEHLVRAQASLRLVAATEPGLEGVALDQAQLAWLQEFLSECCLMLLRDLALSQLRQHPIAVGT